MFKVSFVLGNEYASHIDRWIATAIRKEVEEIDLNFRDENLSCHVHEKYVFPVHLLHSVKTSCLKRLCLNYCTLRLSSRCTSWLSHLTTLHLRHVPLHQSDVDRILSGGLILTTLKLISCSLPHIFCIHGKVLKKLVISDTSEEVKLNCPNLEKFNYDGKAKFTFDHVPFLRKVKLLLGFRKGGCSAFFEGLNRQAPLLQALSLLLITEVQPLPARNLGCCLKQLALLVMVPYHYEILTITHFVNASPFLDTLRLKLAYRSYTIQRPRRTEYPDRPDHPHFRLKEVEIKGFRDLWNEAGLALYLLRNAVVLEQMVIEVVDGYSRAKQKETTLLEQNINPTAEVVIL